MKLDGGSVLTTQRFTQILEEEMTKLRSKLGAQRFDGGHFTQVLLTTCARLDATLNEVKLLRHLPSRNAKKNQQKKHPK